MEYTKEELLEAQRQIDSTLHKLRATIVTLQGQGKPGAVQVTDHACPAPGESL